MLDSNLAEAYILSLPECPMCILFDYEDAEGHTHIFAKPCDLHRKELES